MRYPAWFVPLAGPARAPVRLFAFPYSGAGARAYASWKRWLPQEVQLLGVQLPGRAPGLDEALIAHMETLVDALVPDLLPLLDQPYQLFGHSNGALMAYAVAERLARLGARLPDAVILSGKPSPTAGVAGERLSTLPEPAFLDKLREFAGTPPELLDNPAFMRLFSPALRADFALGETFTPGPVDPALAAVPALLLAGASDTVAVADVFAWQDIFTHSSPLALEGGHFFIHGNAHFAQAVSGFIMRHARPA